jgi:hypothetical protein
MGHAGLLGCQAVERTARRNCGGAGLTPPFLPCSTTFVGAPGCPIARDSAISMSGVTASICYELCPVGCGGVPPSAVSRFSPDGDPSPVQASHPGPAENVPFEPCVMSSNACVEPESP